MLHKTLDDAPDLVTTSFISKWPLRKAASTGLRIWTQSLCVASYDADGMVRRPSACLTLTQHVFFFRSKRL